ncbi:MAG: galactose-1-phosphate uridylyltransferase [Candidatus Margulisiibacteriota bacterium]
MCYNTTAMPELRQNPATKEWVIIATERAKRPEDLGSGTCQATEAQKQACPFCPGKENLSPGEILAYRDFGTGPDSPGWWIRIIHNKYAALMPDGKNRERTKLLDYFTMMNGLGEHEVIIESPHHDQTIATMDEKQVEELFLAYRERYVTLSKDPQFEMIIIFKNHGIGAGTSLHHPHSQLIATPITPSHIRHRLEESMRYFDDNGRCVYCEMIAKEKSIKERVIMETDNFIAISPFASRSPFETKILPKKHASSFDSITTADAKELAFVMRTILKKLFISLNNPDYNFVINSSPCHEKETEYYHWYINVIPRVSAVAGFELGSGIYINTVIPEEAAKYLRTIKTE